MCDTTVPVHVRVRCMFVFTAVMIKSFPSMLLYMMKCPAPAASVRVYTSSSPIHVLIDSITPQWLIWEELTCISPLILTIKGLMGDS